MLVLYKRLKSKVMYSSTYPICHILLFDLILEASFHQGEECDYYFFLMLGECFEGFIYS